MSNAGYIQISFFSIFLLVFFTTMPYRAAAESFVGHSEEFAKKAHRNADSPVVRSAATCQTAMGMDSQRLRILRNRTLSTQSLSKVADRLYRKRQSYEFVDGFEKYAVGSKIFNNMEQMKGFNDKFFFRFGGPWTQYLGTHKGVNAENNVFEVTDTLSYSGNKSFHFRIVQEDLDAAALQGAVVKNSLIKDDLVSHDPFAFGDGDIVSVSAYLYLPSGTNEWVGSQDNWNPYFLDVGAARQGLPSLPELRIASNKGPSGYFALNRKTFWEGMTPPNIATAPLAWPPLDEWFQLEMRFKVGVLPEDDLQSYPDQGYGAGRGVYEFDENAPAWFQLIIDGQVIIENTMTTRGGFENDGTVINSLEIGLTISGQASELYIDDVRLQETECPFGKSNGVIR